MVCKVQSDKCSGRQEYLYCSKHYQQVKRHGKVITSRRDKRPAVIEGDFAKIPLGINAKNGYAVVDKKFAHLAQDNWCLTHYGYVKRSRDKMLLHRLITGVSQGMVIDHANGDPLDNTTQNLRICTQAENARNQRIKVNNTTGYKGVTKNRGRYAAKIKCNYKYMHLGYFQDAIEAAKAYNAKAIELHGEFARLNSV